MDSMDLKGIAWVGHIYQKFEAMCLEVEEAMCQETAKYVENQVQTVGAGVKRFCSDVMQDLLPPSSKDLSRVASADLLLNPYLEFGVHKKPVSNIKESAININPDCVNGISEDKSNSSNDVWEDWSAASFNWDISDKDEENCEQMGMQASNETPVTSISTKSSAKVVKRSRCISSSNILRAERGGKFESRGLVSQVGLQATFNKLSRQSTDGGVSHTDSSENRRPISVSQIGSNANADTQCGQSVGDERISVSQIGSIVNADTQCGQSVGDERISVSQIGSNVNADTQCGQSVGDEFRSNTGSSADCDPDIGEKTKSDASMGTMEPIRHEFESGFEEMCVLVDGNDYLPGNNKEEIRRSYKKKIQNAFSLKKKSTRKQEYKQLAAQYSFVNAETDKKCDSVIPLAPVLSESIIANKLATHDSVELEWELL